MENKFQSNKLKTGRLPSLPSKPPENLASNRSELTKSIEEENSAKLKYHIELFK